MITPAHMRLESMQMLIALCMWPEYRFYSNSLTSRGTLSNHKRTALHTPVHTGHKLSAV